MDEGKEIVKESLCDLLRKANASLDVISAVDEIVLSYVFSYVEELGCERGDDGFDVEEFMEVMEAYLPGFSSVQSSTVCDWVFELAGRISRTGKSPTSVTLPPSPPVNSNCFVNNIHSPFSSNHKKINTVNCKESSNGNSNRNQQNEVRCEEKGASGGQHEKDDLAEQVELLLEMFPGSCSTEVKHCLKMSEGDTGKAAELVLHRREAGTFLKGKIPKQAHKTSSRKEQQSQDETLKRSIISRYSFIDENEDKRNHKPLGPKQEEKKMVRYREGKIVSLKGERFSEVKKAETDEMKKTYISLKPAKQYRFH